MTRKEFCTHLTPLGFGYLQKKANTLTMVRISDFEFHPAKIEKVYITSDALPSIIIEYIILVAVEAIKFQVHTL